MTEFSFFCGGGGVNCSFKPCAHRWAVMSLFHKWCLPWVQTHDETGSNKTENPRVSAKTDGHSKKKKKIGSCTRWQGSDDEQLQDLLSKTGSPLTQVHLGSFKKAYIVQCVLIIPMKTRVNQAPRTSSLAGTHLSLEVHHLSRISSTLSRQKLTDCSSSAIFLSRTTPERVLSEALHQLAETLVAFL